ncbi:hypothetical protein ACH5RR_039385 [Cinchona calisaya]|uniref:Uncharacterized protein n=1 Tax=Cinchona calisaya TaxID=153742 RepID=A0ABD2XY24_9GENT
MADKLNDIVCAPYGSTFPEQQFQPQSAPRAFSRYGQRRPPTRAYPNPELDALQPQVLSKIGASNSFGEEGPISRGLNGVANLLDATFKATNGNMSGSFGIVGTSHHVVDSTLLSQTIVNAPVPQVLYGAFHSKVTHSASNSTGVGIRATNMNCSNGESQQRVDGMGSIHNASNMSTLIVDSQQHDMQPIGPHRSEFMKYLGKLARNGIRLPFTYEAWNDIPEDKLDLLWDDIQIVTTCPPVYKINCMKSLDEKWRSWESVLKGTYFKGKSMEEALANVPAQVQPEQWKVLVEYWSLENVQSIADKNGPSHRTDRTPHAIIRQEMKDKGLETDQLSVYIRTRTDPNGVPKGQMREKLSQIPATEQTSEVKQRIFKEVMGSECRGYARTVGLGPSPS